jgi:hypothetical protein
MYRLRTIDPTTTFTNQLTMDLFAQHLPQDQIVAALTTARQRQHRVRKLSHVVVVWLVIAMNIWTHLSIEHAFQKLARGLRFIWPEVIPVWPTRSAVCQRRYQLGVQPFVTLFQQRCIPFATPATPGAFAFGYRLMAIDGTVETVPDSPSNAAYFGRMSGSRGASAFPQLRAVYLVECGTHALVDAGFWPCQTHERVGGYRMLRTLQSDMLVMWDRGFHAYSMFAGAMQRGAQVLARLSMLVTPQVRETLADGSALIDLLPTEHVQTPDPAPIRLRMITYHLKDPALGDPTVQHRIVTTLLDPQRYPAVDLVCTYHERWEIELVIDELDTHQRVVGRPLRSQLPVGVLQELYGVLVAHYLVRIVMHEAALVRGVDPDRISFVHAVRLIQDAIPESQMVDPVSLPQLYTRLLRDLGAVLLPPRRMRLYPRLVKQKMTKFLRKRPDDPPLPQPTMPFRAAVALVIEPLTPVKVKRPRGRPRKEPECRVDAGSEMPPSARRRP